MEESFAGKDKRFLIFAVLVGVALVCAAFLLSYLNYLEGIKNSPPSVQGEKNIDPVIQSISAPADGQAAVPVSKEILDSLTAPAVSGIDQGKSKTIQPTPTPIPKEILNSLSAPN